MLDYHILNLSKKYKPVGFDINKNRIKELKLGLDRFKEFNKSKLKNKKIIYTSNLNDIKKCNIYIITVPTPITKYKKPDLSHLKKVCKNLNKVIVNGDIIIFESTVYPATENVCIPLLEKILIY